MLVAVDNQNNRCIAWLTEKTQAPFHCPACNEVVVLKKGKIREHHFAHKPPTSCSYATGESQKHYKVKREIFTALVKHANCSKCDIERPLSGVRPDISLYIGNTPVAIEIQRSNIDIELIEKRTRQYTKLGISLLWVFPDNSPPNSTFIEEKDIEVWRPKEWQKYIHAMYFGRIYFWQHDAIVKSYHLSSYRYYVEAGNWVEDFYDDSGTDLEGTYWHDEHHPEADYGGNWRTSKTKRQLHPGEELHIAEAFQKKMRGSFHSKYWSLPKANLWIDKNKNWWK